MATQTTNIKLKKPVASENINLTDINANWDAIDAAFGALGTGNNVKDMLTQESAAGRYKSTSSSTWDSTVSGLTGSSTILTTDAKAYIVSYANGVESLAADSTISSQSIVTRVITVSHTTPSSGSTSNIYAGVVLFKYSSTVFGALVIPSSGNIPFYIRRNSGTRQIRVLI